MDYFNISSMFNTEIVFTKYSETSYAMEVIFRQCNRSEGKMELGGVYLGRKDYSHGYKTKFSVEPYELVISHMLVRQGSISETEILLVEIYWEICELLKSTTDMKSKGNGELAYLYISTRYVLLHRGYTEIVFTFILFY